MRAAVFVAVALAGCAVAPRARLRQPIVAGELLVVTAEAAVVSAEVLTHAAGRADFSVKEIQCLPRACRVVLERVGAPADEAWTWDVIESLGKTRIPGVQAVEPNGIRQPL